MPSKNLGDFVYYLGACAFLILVAHQQTFSKSVVVADADTRSRVNRALLEEEERERYTTLEENKDFREWGERLVLLRLSPTHQGLFHTESGMLF